ncbi:protein-glutamate O-methyltransferase CheR [Methylobacter sp.]|uniref:CheR family methyltransferase n=1 Tax=Methylobacter sp. TaxID=2051955 RepID=UPI00121B9D1F|nr:protein-glutamate O-methyltransferase CheR [Methylobacter sp.]TAK65202.1 MAG: protein-glutamate O-methyltransferase CheR [Methylobacter sp.]
MTAYALTKPNLAAAVLQDKEFTQFRDLIYRIAGINMSPAKKPLVTSRLAKRLRHYGLTSYGDYFKMITADNSAEELQIAVDLLTTNETHFFREPKHFDFLRQRILPERKPGTPFRIWSAACSSGEEPYSIAMLLDDALANAPWEIVASDLSTRMLEKARTGLYPLERMLEIPKPYLSNYCLKGTGTQEGTLLIERKLRERVRFIHYNLTEAPPKLGGFDVVFLRNVMIYFDQNTKRQVVSSLLSLLRPGGYILIGHSETLNGISDDVRLVQPAVYRKL